MTTSSGRLMTPLGVAVLMACGGGTDSPGPPAQIQAVSGDAQSATVGDDLSQALTVKVVDDEGRGVPGVAVDFRVVSGGGSISSAAATNSSVSARVTGALAATGTALLPDTTDETGLASANWTLGTQAGEQTARASVASLTSVDFTATATAGPPASVVLTSGVLQVAQFGAALPQPITIRAADQFGNVAPGAAVSWNLDEGEGSFSDASAATGSDGTASVRLTLGTTSVFNSVSATVGGVTSDSAFGIAMSTIHNDPAGDFICDTCSSQFSKPDFIRLGGVLDVDFLLFFLEFQSSVSFLANQTVQASNTMFGFFDIDSDQDSTTGIETLQDLAGLASSGMGVDAFFELNPTSQSLPAGAPDGSIPIIRVDSVFAGGDSIIVAISAAQPVLVNNVILFGATLDFLQDDGAVSVASFVGTPDLATDFAPNSGGIPVDQTTAARSTQSGLPELRSVRSVEVRRLRMSLNDFRRWRARER